ncbi:MAG: ribosome small subunit-dependent GTPase A [Actinomycetota bacterium]
MHTSTGSALERYGWNTHHQRNFDAIATPEDRAGRVAVEHRGAYILYTADGEMNAEITGKMRHAAAGRGDLPAVGDWIAYRSAQGGGAMIHAVLPRVSKFSRSLAGDETVEQIVAANVDMIFLASALDQDMNVRRTERYLTMAWESGAIPVIVLTKSDLCENLPFAFEEFAQIAPGVSIHAVSSIEGDGLDELTPYLSGNKTIAILGSSGVGKSTLINRLVGQDLLAVRDIREDGKGRHTTTHRQLVPLPGGGLIIDTPGMRELQLWDADEGIDRAFDDIASLAEGCRFRDCAHETEPGCAVLAAIGSGALEQTRLDSYRKLLRELAALERKRDKRLASAEARKWKLLNKDARKRARLR